MTVMMRRRRCARPTHGTTTCVHCGGCRGCLTPTHLTVLHRACLVQNAEVWGWLCLLCVTATPLRETEAAQALEQALKLGLKKAPLLAEIGEEYMRLGKVRSGRVLLSPCRQHVLTTGAWRDCSTVWPKACSAGRSLRLLIHTRSAFSVMPWQHRTAPRRRWTCTARFYLPPTSRLTGKQLPAASSP